jgi:ribosome biogenesis protein Nip4
MNNFVTFRKINQIEKKIIGNFLSNISSNNTSNFKDFEQNIYVFIRDKTHKTDYPQIYLLSEELRKIIDSINAINDISSGGLYFGFIKRGKFYVSLEGAEYLHKRGYISDLLQLYVNTYGEKSILYGNNILKNMLIMKTYRFKQNDFILVFNDKDELIAIGRSAIEGNDIKNLTNDGLVANNLSDKGRYLRVKQ